MPTPRRFVLVVWLLAAGLTACGDDEAPSDGRDADATAPSEERHHIHGVGVDPRSGALYIATHRGLFLAPPGKTRAARVGDSEQDIMGFAIAAPGRFIGSGHPAPSQDLPHNLGLIESRDAGRSWRSVSLAGEADFHVLRSAGRMVYGVDGHTGRLLLSRDGGTSWSERRPPGAIVDLAVDPGDDGRVVVSTKRGLFASRGLRRWRPLRRDIGGLLAWPAASRIYVLDAQGQILRSRDGGHQFQRVGDLGGQPVAFTGVDDGLYAALSDGTIKSSGDGGETWLVRAVP